MKSLSHRLGAIITFDYLVVDRQCQRTTRATKLILHLCAHTKQQLGNSVADLDMYEIIEPITFYKPTRDSHFKQSQPWNLLLKDMVDRMLVHL